MKIGRFGKSSGDGGPHVACADRIMGTSTTKHGPRQIRMMRIYLDTTATYMVTAESLVDPRPGLPAAVLKCIDENAEWLRGN